MVTIDDVLKYNGLRPFSEKENEARTEGYYPRNSGRTYPFYSLKT